MLNERILNRAKPVDWSAVSEDQEKAKAVLKAVGETLLWVAVTIGIGIYLCLYFVWMVITSVSDGEH